MGDIIRSEEEIRDLLAALEQELVELPDYSLFGDSNVQAKREMAEDIKVLEAALAGMHIKPSLLGRDDAAYWLTSDRSLLGKDYGVG